MPRGPAIEIRPEHGYLALGGRRLALTVEQDDVLRVDGSTRLHPVSFGDRDRIVGDAIAADDPAGALLDAVVARSVVERGGLANGLLRLVAVALAGGEEPELSFAEAARRAGERHGWSWRQILETQAWSVDRAAAMSDVDGGWSLIVFAEPSATEPEALARIVAEQLLHRSLDSTDVTSNAHTTADRDPLTLADSDLARPVRGRRAAHNGSEAVVVPVLSRTATRTSRPESAIVASQNTTATTTPRLRAQTSADDPEPSPSRRPRTSDQPPVRASQWSAERSERPLRRVTSPVARAERRPALVPRAEPTAAAPTPSLHPIGSPRSHAAAQWLGEGVTEHATVLHGTGAPISAIDALDEIARALSVECDLRGIHR
jgi:hypothetical protein